VIPQSTTQRVHGQGQDRRAGPGPTGRARTDGQGQEEREAAPVGQGPLQFLEKLDGVHGSCGKSGSMGRRIEAASSCAVLDRRS